MQRAEIDRFGSARFAIIRDQWNRFETKKLELERERRRSREKRIIAVEKLASAARRSHAHIEAMHSDTDRVLREKAAMRAAKERREYEAAEATVRSETKNRQRADARQLASLLVNAGFVVALSVILLINIEWAPRTWRGLYECVSFCEPAPSGLLVSAPPLDRLDTGSGGGGLLSGWATGVLGWLRSAIDPAAWLSALPLCHIVQAGLALVVGLPVMLYSLALGRASSLISTCLIAACWCGRKLLMQYLWRAVPLALLLVLLPRVLVKLVLHAEGDKVAWRVALLGGTDLRPFFFVALLPTLVAACALLGALVFSCGWSDAAACAAGLYSILCSLAVAH